MSVYESILMFVIAALLLTAAAIHGFVFVMIRLDKRRDEKRRKAKNRTSNYEF